MNKEILKLAIPNIISNISIPILSTVDTALMGRLSIHYLGAVGIGAMIFNFLYWNFGFIRMGTTGLAAQAYGANQHNDLSKILARSLFFSMVIALFIWLVQYPVIDRAVQWMNVVDNQIPLVVEYFHIRILAAPATLMLYGFLGWFFGMQNSTYPLIITIVINVTNILLSFLFVAYYEWDIAGVAWGTVIAQYIGLFLSIAILIFRYQEYVNKQWMGIFKFLSEWKKLLSININLFIRTVCLTFVFAFVYSQSSSLGPIALGANVILLQFLTWMSYGIDGFAYASESIVGKYFGANNKDLFFKSLKYLFIWAAFIALLYSLVYYVIYPYVVPIFTTDQLVIEKVELLSYFIYLTPLAGFACYIWDGVFIGITAVRQMRNSMLIALVAFLLVYYIFTTHNLTQIWTSLTVFLIVRGIVQTIMWYKDETILKAKLFIE